MTGLARAFLSAGAPAVVATLWPVPDREASLLFVDLHRRLRDGMEPAQALRDSQLALSQRGLDPVVWGGSWPWGTQHA